MNDNKTVTAGEPSGNSCHHERHLTGVVLKVYNLIWRLGKKSKDGCVSLSNHAIARMVGAHSEGKRADHITRVKTALVRAGLLEFLGVSRKAGTGNWRGARYRAVAHDEWAEAKSKEIGRSTCHPQPLQIKVSSVHPGGRAFQNKRQNVAEARTARYAEARTEQQGKQSHRAGLEARTDLRAGSTHRASSGKHAQAVDFNSTGDLRSRSKDQLTQGAAPPATPQALPADLPEKQGGASPSQTLPEKREEKSLPTPALSRRELGVQEFNRFMDAVAIGRELSDTASVRWLKESFVMEPSLSPRRRLDALLEQARIYRFNVHPSIVAAMRQLKKNEVLA